MYGVLGYRFVCLKTPLMPLLFLVETRWFIPLPDLSATRRFAIRLSMGSALMWSISSGTGSP